MTRQKLIRSIALSGVVCLILIALAIIVIRRQLFPQLSFEQVVAVKLPTTATSFHSLTSSRFDGGEYFASATIPEGDFVELMGALQLEQNPPALRQYPGTLGPAIGPDWWSKVETPNEQIFFALRPDKTHDGYIAAKYENGRLYLRRSLW
jgi:hypothetical protein